MDMKDITTMPNMRDPQDSLKQHQQKDFYDIDAVTDKVWMEFFAKEGPELLAKAERIRTQMQKQKRNK